MTQETLDPDTNVGEGMLPEPEESQPPTEQEAPEEAPPEEQPEEASAEPPEPAADLVTYRAYRAGMNSVIPVGAATYHGTVPLSKIEETMHRCVQSGVAAMSHIYLPDGRLRVIIGKQELVSVEFGA